MSVLRIAAWTLGGCLLAIVIFLAATIRVIEPAPTESEPPAPSALAEHDVPPGRQPAPGGVAQAPALMVPVAGVAASTLHSNWGEPRGDGTRGHQGLDIMAPANTPVVAAADGTIEKLYLSQGGGGVTLYQRSADGRWVFYYAHLSGYAPGIAEGRQVRAGEMLAYVGDTGNAGTGNYHLHFGVAMMAPGERWWQGTPVDPYPLLAGARRGG